MPAFPLFSSAITAMRAQSSAFAAIGDNIANLQTEGYKATDIRFSSLVSGRNGGGTLETLAGARPKSQTFIEKDGNIEQSPLDLDSAILGQGFYLTNTTTDPNDLSAGTLELTDNGRFTTTVIQPDTSATATTDTEEQYLVDNKGNFVLGWPFNATTNTFDVDTTSSDSLQPIQLNVGGNTIVAEATTLTEVTANLDAGAATGTEVDISIVIHDGQEANNLINGVQGNLGSTSRSMTFTFTKTANVNEWTVTGTPLNGTATSPAFPLTLTFDSIGQTPDFGGAGTSLNLSVNWTDAPAVTTTSSVDFSQLTSFGGESFVTENESDGFPQGIFQSAFLSDNGVVNARFTNGQTRPLFQLGFADVISPDLMQAVTGTHFRVTEASGELQLFDFSTSTRAEFKTNSFENSTVQLESEVAKMIVAQRSYSSAATALKTVDEMVRTATEIKN